MATLTVYLRPSDEPIVDLLKAEGINLSAVCREAFAAKAAELDRPQRFAEGDEVYVLTQQDGLYNGLAGWVKGFWRDMVEVVLHDGRVIMFRQYEIEIGDW